MAYLLSRLCPPQQCRIKFLKGPFIKQYLVYHILNLFFFFFGLTITFLIFYKFCNINLYYNAPWSDNKGGQWREILFLLRRFTLNKPTSHSFKHNCPIFGALATVLPCLSICSYVFFSFNLQCLFNKYIFLFKKINHYETNT